MALFVSPSKIADTLLLLHVASQMLLMWGRGSEQEEGVGRRTWFLLSTCHVPSGGGHCTYIVPHNVPCSAGDRSSCILPLGSLKSFRNLSRPMVNSGARECMCVHHTHTHTHTHTPCAKHCSKHFMYVY